MLAEAYQILVSGENRRQLGTFFTPPAIVRYMIDTIRPVLRGRPSHIVDPGAGVGAFTVSARHIWPTSTTISVDLNVVTLGLLAARVDARAKGRSKGKQGPVKLVPQDYLEWINRDWPKLEGPRLVLGNPPYTRHQLMTASQKKRAREAAGNLVTSGLAGLSAYFLAATINALRPADSLCLLLPGSWCETRYGRELRSWLWHSRRRRVEVDLFPSTVEVFPGTQVTAMILSVGPEQGLGQPFVARTLDLTDKYGRQTVTKNSEVTIDRSGPCPPSFTRLTTTKSATMHADRSLSLGSVATIRRGVATGANNFFFLSDCERSREGLPDKALRPALVKASHCPGDTLDLEAHEAIGAAGAPRWLLDMNGCDAAETDEDLKAYLSKGKSLGVHNRHLAIQRKVWHTVELVATPDIFLAPVGKGHHRVICNEAGAVGSNNLYGIYLGPLAPWNLQHLAAWLRSDDGQLSLQAISRQYQGGSSKIEPRSLRNLAVPVG
ncbi:Eco57I restriction-modification methylase domain-containing protein [Micromonospora phytophila]|uniref:Eco57I restriction-modification methylase domain-containing protein n=1 Tax=Micromonospora phytophila TaxID=709888 RepID=UPI00202FF0BA|nr:Eco57I restriction-modification methylase domain-containing protein [Micromonospora phytophila]MCM0674003.1 Eco57I restriction-modification methylase domain-containing protein [Micromonospora phytophila]